MIELTRFRGLFLPTLKFMRDNELSLQGYGFFTSEHNFYTPSIYSRLSKKGGLILLFYHHLYHTHT